MGTEELSQDPDADPPFTSEEMPRVHQPRRALPTDVVRPTRAEVHLAHLRHNLGILKKACQQKPVWAVLKADGYGHGAKAVARTLERAGVDGICVALVEEGVELRDAGIKLPVLVMGGYYGEALRELRHHRLTPVLSDASQAVALDRAIRYGDQVPMACHVKVDTGMARLGTREPEWPAFAEALARADFLEVEGLMSHLADADLSQEDALEEPLRLFSLAQEVFRARGVSPERLHVANSAALLRDARTHFSLVRPGVALFGVDPLLSQAVPAEAVSTETVRLKPAMSVLSRVVSLRQVPAGARIGYGGTFVAPGPLQIATIPMGYADGLSRALSNKGQVLIRGRRAPIVGSISMDMVMVDVTQIPGVSVLDEVVLLGRQKGALGEDTITPGEMAHWSGTIPWEVLTNISRRVPRFYREA